ncbi:hypothetical protein [Rubricoccus marinus]|nr:hypothetical protein [Rubricoccus marinus]
MGRSRTKARLPPEAYPARGLPRQRPTPPEASGESAVRTPQRGNRAASGA